MGDSVAVKLKEGPLQLTLEEAMEELIEHRISRWWTKQEKVPDARLAAEIVAMCWDFDSLPQRGPGCLLPDHKGGHIYVPYDDSKEGLSPELIAQSEKLDKWIKTPANAPILREMDEVLEKMVDEKCWWEFLGERSNASRVDFHGKASVLPSLVEEMTNAADDADQDSRQIQTDGKGRRRLAPRPRPPAVQVRRHGCHRVR